MARKSLPAKEVVVVSDDDEEDEDDDDANITKYIKPVSVYKHLEARSKNNPYFLRKCLNYIIRAKKKKKSNSGVTIRFNYRDVRNKKTLKAEDVEKFTCPFCLMPCGGHEGLRLHLTSSHDAFNYDFYRAEEDHGPEVDVYLKRETLRFGVLKKDIGDPQLKRFMFCSKHRKGRRKRDDSDNLKRLNARLLELDLDELSRGTENESTHVNNDNVSSPPTRAHPLENTSDILTMTQAAIAESSEPMVVPLVSSGRKKLFAESSEPKVPPVSGRKKLSAQSSEPKEPPVSGRKKSVAESSEPKVPPVSRRKKLSAESSEPKEPPVSGRKKLVAESSEPKEPPVSRRKKLSVESSEPKVSSVSGRKELSAESSEPKEPPVSRRKKSFAERSKAKGVERLKSRQFYHSQTMQPMTFEEVMSNEDSENETDDDALDLHERLRLERIPGASKEEKRYMYLWNIFVRKQRVIADGHVPWACEEFTKLHKEEMKASPSFDWWWRMFRIKLWDDGLICANTFNKCTTIFLNSDEAGPSTSHGPANANTPTMEVDA